MESSNIYSFLFGFFHSRFYENHPCFVCSSLFSLLHEITWIYNTIYCFWIFEPFPIWYYYEYCCYEHSFPSFGEYMYTFFYWIYYMNLLFNLSFFPLLESETKAYCVNNLFVKWSQEMREGQGVKEKWRQSLYKRKSENWYECPIPQVFRGTIRNVPWNWPRGAWGRKAKHLPIGLQSHLLSGSWV